MVNTLQNFWLKHRKIILLAAFLLAVVFIYPHIVHAQSPSPPPPSGGTAPDDGSSGLLAGVSKIIDLLKRIFWPVLLMIGGLMQNDILFGAGMEDRLSAIWVNVRNVVNILFVLILLGIALYNVLGAGENYHLKTILPKFVIALIAVNFTFIGAKVILDSVNVLSTAIFALPDSVQCTLDPSSSTICPKLGFNSSSSGSPAPKIGSFTVDQINEFCGAMFGGDPTDPGSDYQKNLTAVNPGSPPYDDKTSMCELKPDGNGSYLNPSQALQNFFGSTSSQNAALVMAIQLQNAGLLDTVKVNPAAVTTSNLVVDTLFSVILFIVYGTAYVALLVVLLIRLVVLWVGIAVSPLMVLPPFLPEKFKGKLGGGEVDKFIQTAIIPIPVALVMSVGIIMINGVNAAKSVGPGLNLQNNPTLNIGLYTSGISTLQQLVAAFGAAAFIWIGVFEAMKGTFADGAVEAIKGSVEGAGKAIGGFAVKSIPLFPTSKGNITLGAAQVGLQGVRAQMDDKFRQEARKFGLVDRSNEVGGNLGQQKDLSALKKYTKDNVSRGMLQNANVQKGYASFFEGNGKSHLPNDMPKWLANTSAKYQGGKEGVDKFLADLKNNEVSEQDMALFMKQSGLEMASGLEAKPKDAAAFAKKQQGDLDGNQKALINPKSDRRTNIEKNKLLSDDDIKALDQAQKDMTTTEGKTDQPSKDKRAAAIKKIQELDEKAKTAEKAAGDAEANSPGIGVRVGGLIGDAAKAKTKVTFDSLEGDLMTEINFLAKKMAGTGPVTDAIKANAKEQVLKTAGQNMSQQQKDIIMTSGGASADGSLVSQVTPTGPAVPVVTPATAKVGSPAAKLPQLPEVIEEIAASDPRLKDYGNPASGAIVYIDSKKYKVK